MKLKKYDIIFLVLLAGSTLYSLFGLIMGYKISPLAVIIANATMFVMFLTRLKLE